MEYAYHGYPGGMISVANRTGQELSSSTARGIIVDLCTPGREPLGNKTTKCIRLARDSLMAKGNL